MTDNPMTEIEKDKDTKQTQGNQHINVHGDLIVQSGNFGAGHVSESEIQKKVELGGVINQPEQHTKTTQQETAQKTTTKKTEGTTRFLEITISGEFEETNLADILQIQQELVRKLKNININIVEADSGSIKLIFEGSEEDLKLLEALIQSGQLTEVSDRTIENVKFIEEETKERELRNKLDIRNRLVQEIRSQTIEGRNLEKVNLKLSDLSGIFLEQAYLRDAYLSFAYLRDADLSGSRLVKANLAYANLNRANLVEANLIGADLRNAQLLMANLSDADLSGVNVSNARFRDNLGISESMEHDLIQRGAIFEDSPPGDRSGVLTPV